MQTTEAFPIGTWVRAWTTSIHEPGGGEVFGWVEGHGTERDRWTGQVCGSTLKIGNRMGGADVRPADVFEVLGPVELAELIYRLLRYW